MTGETAQTALDGRQKANNNGTNCHSSDFLNTEVGPHHSTLVVMLAASHKDSVQAVHVCNLSLQQF